VIKIIQLSNAGFCVEKDEKELTREFTIGAATAFVLGYIIANPNEGLTFTTIIDEPEKVHNIANTEAEADAYNRGLNFN